MLAERVWGLLLEVYMLLVIRVKKLTPCLEKSIRMPFYKIIHQEILKRFMKKEMMKSMLFHYHSIVLR